MVDYILSNEFRQEIHDSYQKYLHTTIFINDEIKFNMYLRMQTKFNIKVCFKDFEYCLLWSIDVIVNSMYFIRILIEPSASNDRVMIFRNYHFIEFSE